MSKQKIYKTPPNERTNKGVQKTDPKIHVGGKRPRTGNVRGRTRLGGPPPAGRAPHEAAVRVRRNQHRAPRLRRGLGEARTSAKAWLRQTGTEGSDGPDEHRRDRPLQHGPLHVPRPGVTVPSPAHRGPAGRGPLLPFCRTRN